MLTRISTIISILAVLIFAVANCSDSRASDGTSEPESYHVAFVARGGSMTGHVYVVLYGEDAEKKMSFDEAVGFYPAQDKKDGLYCVQPTASLGKEWNRGDVLKRLDVKIDRATYEKLAKLRDEWVKRVCEDGEPAYDVLMQDCVTFAADFAKKAGLDVPGRIEGITPRGFVEKLAELNKK